MNRVAIFGILATAIGIYIGILTRRPVSSLSESFRCPFCYGTSSCPDVEAGKVTLRYESVSDFFYNVFSVKNVYFARYEDERVVLKKLGYRSELDEIERRKGVDEAEILHLMNGGGRSFGDFRTCSHATSEKFLKSLTSSFSLEEIWTVLQVNVEPLLLTLQDVDFPVPVLYGRCGFLIIVKDCGFPLNYFQKSDWSVRAVLAARLLQAALNFTHNHDVFRVYLTDISPDNVVVDDALDVYFVDLENVILQQRFADNETIHYSEHVADEDFAYEEGEVCGASLSDHNVYAVCRLLLSREAPWPMMSGGLLHSPPAGVVSEHEHLFHLVEECVYSQRKVGRFDIAKELIRLLKLLSP